MVLFLAISFVISWGYVVLYDTALADRLAGTTATRITPYLADWGPLIPVTVVLWSSNVDLRAWFDRHLTVREPLRFYLFALLVPNVVAPPAMLVFAAAGVALTVSVSPSNFLVVFGFTLVLLGALEE